MLNKVSFIEHFSEPSTDLVFFLGRGEGGEGGRTSILLKKLEH